ncbi:MAG: hypothetical protein H6673_10140 [Anaerolineales bacterium]|nr:hypothetical protein [Anaerolineales bacterium]
MDDAPFIRHEYIILDASSVINLYATGYMPEIIRSLLARCAVSDYVKEREAQAVYGEPDKNGKRERIPIDWDMLIDEGILEICSINSPSVSNTIIVLASDGIRGMGEKISGAIAFKNDWGIVLDDHSATSKLAARMPHIQMLTTLDLLQYWVNSMTISDEILMAALINLRVRGNYIVPRNHHLYEWVAVYVDDE